MKKIIELSIGQIAKKLDIPVHTLRFWTKNFPHIQPKIGNGKRRYYNQFHLEELKKIKDLIQKKHLGIKAIQEMIKYNSIKIGNSQSNDFKEKLMQYLQNSIEISKDISNLCQN